MKSTISVVIVAGACGIAAGTLLAILGAIGQAARRGPIATPGRFLMQAAYVAASRIVIRDLIVPISPTTP